jgi:hypothetical protein
MSVHGPTDWSVVSTPAVSTQASASKAAAGANMKHVCTGIYFALMAVAAQTIISVNLRDGASGAGNILWSKQFVIPINGIVSEDISDLAIPGSYNTAMTLEFSGAPVATNYESVVLTGYDSA